MKQCLSQQFIVQKKTGDYALAILPEGDLNSQPSGIPSCLYSPAFSLFYKTTLDSLLNPVLPALCLFDISVVYISIRHFRSKPAADAAATNVEKKG